MPNSTIVSIPFHSPHAHKTFLFELERNTSTLPHFSQSFTNTPAYFNAPHRHSLNMFRAVLIASFLAASAMAAGDCYLRQNTTSFGDASTSDQSASKVAKKPFPSLTQCYKYNTESCCVSGHDQEIAEHFKSHLSDTCLREFPELEVFMCFGCNPDQPKFVDLAKKEIRICKGFAKALFDTDRTQYDACGLRLSGSSSFFLPSFHYKNSASFLNAFKPPLFSDFTIVLTDDGDDCFTNSVGKVMVSFGAIALVLASTMVNLL